MNIAFADDSDDPIQLNDEWLSLYKATTHLSMICDTYLRSRQNLIHEDGHDIIQEQEWSSDLLDPFILKDYLTDLGYSTPPELQKQVDEHSKEKENLFNLIENFQNKVVNLENQLKIERLNKKSWWKFW